MVDAEDPSGRVLKGNPVRIRDCARSCVIHNGSESNAITQTGEKAGAGRSQKTCQDQVKHPGSGTSPRGNVNSYSIMKKARLLLLCGALVSVFACQKDPIPETYRDADLTGEKVDLSGVSTNARKVFVLNEGGMGSNNSTLDFLRISDANYVTGAFKKMNPSVGAGLGDVGNDIVVVGDEAWMVINNSGLVEVISAKDETEIAAIQVPTPRSITYDNTYAYVTSWAGAYANGSYDEYGYYSVTDYKNVQGQVYRINLNTKKVEGSIQVGYQPEGIACYNGKLYVANSGGISSQLPPDYSYDNTVTVIDTKTFKAVKTLDVQINLKSVFSDGKGNIYVTTLGDYWSVHSGVYMIDTSDNVKHISDYVSVAAIHDGTLYCIGAEEEFDWSAPKTWKAFSVKDGTKATFNMNMDSGTTPYGLFAFGNDAFLVGDVRGDYFNPGTVSLYSKGNKTWTVTAGVCPGHFAIW